MLVTKHCLFRLARWSGYLFLGVLLLMASFFLKVVNKSCSYARAERVQLDLCARYHRHEIAGSMCSTLCDSRQLYLQHCGNNRARAGRKDVLIMGCDGCNLDNHVSKVVMKIQVTDSLLENATETVWERPGSVERVINRTRRFVEDRIRQTFDESDFITAEDFMTGILGENFRNNLKHKSSVDVFVSLKSVIALALQPEVITLLAFRKLPFTPKLYGHCGPAYIMEYTPPLTSSGYVVTYNTKSSDLLNMQYKMFPWSDRARLGLQFLDIIRHMNVIGKKPLQICDFKPHNFGIKSGNNVAFLDLDDMVFDMRSKGLPCLTDDDCVINFCSAYCDKRKNTCSSKRKNNNLSIACKFLFLGDYELLGLLRSPPEAVREELRDVLVRCSEPERYNQLAVTDQIDHAMIDRLETILRKSIEVSR